MSDSQKASVGRVQKFGIDLGSGVVAGAAAAILSQPADTLLSQVNILPRSVLMYSRSVSDK